MAYDDRTQYYLQDGRQCFPFPWESKSCSAPWKNGYSRVIVPFNVQERRFAKGSKQHHTLIVQSSKVKKVEQPVLQLGVR